MTAGRILNVNDRAATRYMITRMLHHAGFAIDEAHDGEGALSRVGDAHDLVVLDVQLPGIDGYEVCRRVKANPTTASLPVLLTSASFVHSDDRVEGLDAGADAYLVQPFEPTELVATVRALLRARAAERRAQALADELAEAVRARDVFLSVATHELKTPLTALLLRLELLQREGKRSGNARFASGADAVVRQAHRLSALVDELLDVSRIASGRFEIRRAAVDLAVVVREVVERFLPEAARVGAPLTVETPAALPATLDRTRIEQVVSNLVANAIKYGAASPVHVRLAREGDAARLVVRDGGIGIDAADLERVFGRFERAAPGHAYGGLGLGLFLARQIVEAHGGGIRVTSEPGAGSTFTVELSLVG